MDNDSTTSATAGQDKARIQGHAWKDLPNDTERTVQRDQGVLERERSNALRVGRDVTEIANMPIDVRRGAMRPLERVEVGASGRATVAQVTGGTTSTVQ